MKKKILLIIFMFIIFTLNIKASENIHSFYCEYDIPNVYFVNTDSAYSVKLRIEVNDYDNGNGNSTINAYFWDEKKQKWQSNAIGVNKDGYYSFTVANGTSNLKNNFIKQYEKTKSCPSLYANKVANNPEITVDISYYDEDAKSHVLVNSNDFKIKNTKDDDWKNLGEVSGNKKCYCCGNSQGCKYIVTDKPGDNCVEVADSKCQNQETVEIKNCPYKFNLENQSATTNEIQFITRKNLLQNESYFVIKDVKSGIEQIVKLDGTTVTVRNSFADIVIPGDVIEKVFRSSTCPNSSKDICSYWSNARDKVEFTLSTNTSECLEKSDTGNYSDGSGSLYNKNGKLGVTIKEPTQTGFGNTGDECKQVLGETLSALVKEVIKWVRIFGGIIAIVNATLKLIPAIMSKDAEALNKAIKTCVIMAIILVFCILFGWMLNLIGKLFKWDVTCIV